MSQAAALILANDRERWDAVCARDARTDGLFVYGVQTTGVYCRPNCPSRRPRRSNVRFFADCEQAERAGFRSCRKCRPKAERLPGADAVVRACRLIDEAGDVPSLSVLAAAVGLSPSHFQRLFTRTIGMSPKAYAAARRAERFRDGLHDGRTVTQAMYDAGYVSSSRCYERVKDDLGMRPSDYRNGGAGQTIRFLIVECSLGWMLVAATGIGVCLIEFGDTPDDLPARLKSRFPKADVRDDDAGLAEWVGRVLTCIDEPGHRLDLPLDIQGTAFQQRVWMALQSIPAGSTATYSEIAARVGMPKASRAVGAACAANRLAVAIPCHRVVRNDGGLSGYRWGLERKRALLEREAKADR